MTMFVGGGLGLPVGIRCRNDFRNCDEAYFEPRAMWPGSLPTCNELLRADNAEWRYVFKSRWWPRAGSLVGGLGEGDPAAALLALPAQWIAPRTQRGANGRLAFVGITRDQHGSPLGGCTVRCYRTSTNELVSQVLSDPVSGAYFATSPHGGAHFLVVHGPGGTIAGATPDSLVPR